MRALTSTSERSSLRGLAGRLGVSEAAIRKGVKHGRLTARSIGHVHGRPYVKDIALAEREWEEGRGALPQTGRRDVEDPGVPDPETLGEAISIGLLELALRTHARGAVTCWRSGFPVEFNPPALLERVTDALELERARALRVGTD